MTQLTQAIGSGVPRSFQSGEIDLAILSQSLHQPETHHSQSLICIQIDSLQRRLISHHQDRNRDIPGRYRLPFETQDRRPELLIRLFC